MTNADCIVDSFDPEVSPKNKRQLTEGRVAGGGRVFDRHPGGGAGDGGLYCADGG